MARGPLTRRDVPAAAVLASGIAIVGLAGALGISTIGRSGPGIGVLWALLAVGLATGVGVTTAGATSLWHGLVRLPLALLVGLAVVGIPACLAILDLVPAEMVWANVHVLGILALLSPLLVWGLLGRRGVG